MELKRSAKSDLHAKILARTDLRPDAVWTPVDFLDLGPRATVDKALQRLVLAEKLRRIDRGLYDRPRQNTLTGRQTVPDYRAVIDAVTRRDQARGVVDGMTAANDSVVSDHPRVRGYLRPPGGSHRVRSQVRSRSASRGDAPALYRTGPPEPGSYHQGDHGHLWYDV